MKHLNYSSEIVSTKDLKHVLLFIAANAVLIIPLAYYTTYQILVVPSIMLGIIVFNILVRKSLYFENYFTSKYNILTAKYKNTKKSDISKDLIFEKIIEITKESEFKLVQADGEKFKILVNTKLVFFSRKGCGENIYINVFEDEEGSVIEFCSVTLFGFNSHGKNQVNYINFIEHIENSLII